MENETTKNQPLTPAQQLSARTIGWYGDWLLANGWEPEDFEEERD